jgi:hypothetical protein
MQDSQPKADSLSLAHFFSTAQMHADPLAAA